MQMKMHFFQVIRKTATMARKDHVEKHLSVTNKEDDIFPYLLDIYLSTRMRLADPRPNFELILFAYLH